MQPTNTSVREFHVSRDVRDRYQLSETLFSLSGNVLFANFQAARVFAQKMNAQRDLVRFPEKTVRAGHINAMGLIDEILHFVFAQYREQENPEVMALCSTGWRGNTVIVPWMTLLAVSSTSFLPWRSTRERQPRTTTWPARATAWPIARSSWKRCSCSGWPT